MKKYIITIIVSLVIGFLLSNYMIKEYDDKVSLLPAFGATQEQAYLIQQGVYSTMDSMKENTSQLNDYIYTTIDNLYYVYIGLTLDSENVLKLQNYYKEKGIDTIVKTTTIHDKSFLETIKQYDKVLKETNDKETIKEVNKQILSKYKGGESGN